MERVRKTALNIIINYIRYFVIILIFFFMTPFIIKNIGKSDYGLWSIILSTVGYFALMDFGFSFSAVKYVSECKGRKDIESRNKLINTLFVVYIFQSIAVLIIAFIISIFFNRMFQIKSIHQEKSTILFWIMSIKLVINMPLSIFRGVLFGEQKIYLISIVSITFHLFRAFLIWMFLSNGYGVITLGISNFIAMFLEYLSYFFICLIKLKDFKINLKYFDKSILKEVSSFSVYIFILNIASIILLKTDPIIIKLFLPLTSVALYSLALRIAETLMQLVKQFVNAITPLIGELKGAGEKNKMKLVFLKSSKFALAIMACISLGISIYSKEIILFWVGAEFQEANVVLIILLTSMVFSIVQTPASDVLVINGYHKYIAFCSILGVALNIFLSVTLIKYFNILGVAGATLISTMILSFPLIIRKSCLFFEISIFRYARKVFIPLFFPFTIAVFSFYYLKKILPPNNLLQIFLQLLFVGLIYLISLWFLFITMEEKKTIKNKILRNCNGNK